MAFAPCFSVKDTAASIAFYEKLGFTVDSSSAEAGDDIHMLFHGGDFCGMLYSNAQLKEWLPVLADTPIGFAGMHYLGVDDIQEAHDRFARHAEIVKPLIEHNGMRLFYFRDLDGYVIGVNEKSAVTPG
ncbi:VOC family protein [Streptomyces sp. BG9H]|uniref:VOC family protein n=1 Tax=Streptomyces anatolicus TaxID=2675858 RepID=A0ABS6YH33_9ACTN|nr:VOC family protein [Streptomyces anatolicus]MBW5420718.1 VOC family protein [Streptomyces anatolicus]